MTTLRAPGSIILRFFSPYCPTGRDIALTTVLNSAHEWLRCQRARRAGRVGWHDLCGIAAHYINRLQAAAIGGTAMSNGLRRRVGVVAAGIGFGMGLAARVAPARKAEADLRGAVVLITGGSRGLGLAMSRELAQQGCRLAICARDESGLEAARSDLQRFGAEVLAVPCDVSDQAQVASMVEAVIRHYGRIDILINNAGIIVVAPVESLTRADFERVMAINFWGAFNPTMAVLPGMRAQGSGRIVNITSIGGKVAVPHLLPYSCAKFAAVGFSEGLRAELADTGISVTTVVPGLMRTGSHMHAEFSGEQQAEYRWFALGASAPYPVAIGADRAARLIVRAARRGEAECTYPVSAVVAARFSGLFPSATTTALSLVDRLLPQPARQPAGSSPGAAIDAELDGPLLRAVTFLGRAAAKEYKQVPPSS
jgi:NAD(P)-dependent dehydrogenase (short-subunit alcohol dehydrogenase family)